MRQNTSTLGQRTRDRTIGQTSPSRTRLSRQRLTRTLRSELEYQIVVFLIRTGLLQPAQVRVRAHR